MNNNDSRPSSSDFDPTIALLKLMNARAEGLIGGPMVDAKIAELNDRVTIDILDL